MNRIFSWVKNVLLRQAIAVFLITLAFLGIPAFAYDHATLAQADTVKTPEGIYYKGTPDGNEKIKTGNKLVEKARNNLQDTTENVKDRFNTDKSLSGNISDTVRTPEGTYYKGTPDNNSNIVDKAKQGLQETAENIKEKLNLDEPLPRSTKEFLKSTEGKVEDTVKPLTKTQEGYYQNTVR